MKKAFTLAEVLITLSIIGIVAALTIPTLMSKYQKTQYVTQLKKDYSMWNQALIQMANDAGCPGDISCIFDTTDETTIGNKLAEAFKVAKNCRKTDTGCFPDVVAQTVDYKAGWSGPGWDTTSTYRFTTADGMAIRFYSVHKDCNYGIDQLKKVCIDQMAIDVNGLKGPNSIGRDIFKFTIVNDNGPAFYPAGGPKFNYWSSSGGCAGSGYQGGGCAGRIIDDGWDMKY